MLTPLLRTPGARRLLALGACCFLLVSPGLTARAARPLITDDARITDAHACQIETWRKSTRAGQEFWAFPACNPTGNLELTLGANELPDGTGSHTRDYVLQGKTLFHALESGGYGWGLAAGVMRHGDLAPGQARHAATYFYVPVSASFRNDQVIVHLNLGAQDNRDARERALTYGLGSEINFSPRFALIAEMFGDHRTQPFYQAGIRFWVVPGRFQVDATHGARAGDYGGSRWWTVGVRLISPAFLK